MPEEMPDAMIPGVGAFFPAVGAEIAVHRPAAGRAGHSGLRHRNKKGRHATAFAKGSDGNPSGLHDVPAGRAILDEALATLRFCGAVLGSRHAAASGFLGHGINFLWLD